MIFKLATEPPAHPPTYVPWAYVPWAYVPWAYVPWAYVAWVYVAWVCVDDITGHYERAKTGGAMIVTELRNPWGLPF